MVSSSNQTCAVGDCLRNTSDECLIPWVIQREKRNVRIALIKSCELYATPCGPEERLLHYKLIMTCYRLRSLKHVGLHRTPIDAGPHEKHRWVLRERYIAKYRSEVGLGPYHHQNLAFSQKCLAVYLWIQARYGEGTRVQANNTATGKVGTP